MISQLSHHLKAVYRQTRFDVGKNAWPPEQPKDFTPVVLVHYEEPRTMKDATIITATLHTGGIRDVISVISDQQVSRHPKLESHQQLREALQTSKVTKNISDILVSFEQSDNPQIVLIEGAPGIGKSMLMKHIAYNWAEGEVLVKFQLVLLIYLRDPGVHKISSVIELLHSFCKCNVDATSFAPCNKTLFQNNGKSIVFLLDGYDELPMELRENSLIASIINRQVLPECGLVVSSRPHASLCLHNKASLRVDILGFTEIEREHFIAQSLKKQPQKVSQLMSYLQHNTTISSLCFTPFNMTVLLFLYKQGVPLPSNSTELYKLFICATICRYLTQFGNTNPITDINNLPEPCGKIIVQLSKLSLQALNNNQLIFTTEEIKTFCPHLENVPGALNGFGLLQVVEHHNVFSTARTFNFIHFSIQEYLAAYCIAYLLPSHQERFMIEQYFWNNFYYNMFNIYVTLTKGQSPSFKLFLCSGSNESLIDDKYLSSELKSLQLYQCFHEVGDTDMCQTIEQKFLTKEIFFWNTTLSPNDLQNVITMLTGSSIKCWREVDLGGCYVQDYGMQLLHRGLRNTGVTIEQLWLSYNNLSLVSDSSLCEIICTCKVKSLAIEKNKTVGETEQFITTVLSHPSSRVEVLYMTGNKYSSNRWAVQLFTLLVDNKSLRVLNLAKTNIADDVCNVIIRALQVNNTLTDLIMWYNPITAEVSQLIVDAIKDNNALQLLAIPKYSETINEKIYSLQEAVNKHRTNRNCSVKLKVELENVS